jgi:hypothetical protein
VRLVPRLTTLALATCLLMLASTSTLAQSPSAPPSAEPSPTAQTAVPGQPEVVDYDLGTVTIERPSQARLNPDFVEMPVHLQGIVAVPEGEGPFPVALLMHGSYSFCTAMAVGDDPAPYPCPPENDLRHLECSHGVATRVVRPSPAASGGAFSTCAVRVDGRCGTPQDTSGSDSGSGD